MALAAPTVVHRAVTPSSGGVAAEPGSGAGSTPPIPPPVGTVPAVPAESFVEVQRDAGGTSGSGSVGVDTADSPASEAPVSEGDPETAVPDVNALFRKLYPRVRDELRWDLRIQRERAGMLSDPL